MKAVNMMNPMTSIGDLLPFSQSTNIFLFFFPSFIFFFFDNLTIQHERLLIKPIPGFSVFIFMPVIRALDDPVRENIGSVNRLVASLLIEN